MSCTSLRVPLGLLCWVLLKWGKTTWVDPEQHIRLTDLEIKGIPETLHENLTAIVLKLGDTIGINPNSSAMTFRSVRRQSNARTRDLRPDDIIVQMESIPDKEHWLQKARRQHFLTAHDIDHQYERRVVTINEHLSTERKKLLVETKKFARKFNFRYVWTKNGVIYIRKDEGCRYVRVDDYSVLDELVDYATYN